MKIIFSMISLLFVLLVVSCGGEKSAESQDSGEVVQSVKKQPAVSSNVKQLTVSQFEKIRRAGVQMNVIDVRTPEEVAQGKIPGAEEMDYEGGDFEERLDGLQKELSYIMYCRTGRRSSEAAELMVQKGFRSVYNLEGGYEAWILEDMK